LHCPENNNVCVWDFAGNSNLWTFQPNGGNVNVSSVVVSFDENEIRQKMQNIKPEYFTHQTCQYSGYPYTTTVQLQDQVSHSSTLSFTEGFVYNWSNTIKIGFEGLGDNSTTIGFSLNFSSTQSSTDTCTKSIGSSVTVNVNEKTVYACIILKKAVIDLNFALTVTFTNGDRYTSHGVWNGLCFGDITTAVVTFLPNNGDPYFG